MKSTAPKELGILVIAAVFGIIGGGVALVMYEASFVWSLVVAGVVAIVVAVALWLGWREPAPREIGARPLGPKAGAAGSNPAQRAGTAGVAAGSAGPAPGSAGVAAGSAPAPEDRSVQADAPTATAPAPQDRSASDDAQDRATQADATGAGTPDASADAHANPGAAGVSTAAAARPAAVKSNTVLPGEEELASRKGEWKYQGASSKDGAGTAPSQADATADRGAPVEAQADPGADGASEAEAQPQGNEAAVATGSGAAVAAGGATPTEDDKPKMLDQARDGGPDNLKEIKGVGPKLEVMLNEMGIYHFDQIANWSDRELAWVDDNLTGFKGRASRDEWVSQAKVLASGGDTEFSSRVDKGDVY